ncbi:hypothetical protein QNI19_38740 [Cytophagaceae bacterium DM2B3-1]|uniref:Uncharacterized protein n=1 Tax=Xanthocytophaga flava TaxID=3048013 RepID=A0ABT7CYU0_9BACT|nr:hypothetical protein [Xanthocytophaga flavus]MDJ1473632.1 hypothetical protein [Xanthocytophaga flavus]MDJ1498928.1 hypothetical protein [Xanthocytophaga flavus]
MQSETTTESVPNANETSISTIGFGFCDQTGKRILIQEDSVVMPESFTKALSKEGKIVDIIFREAKKESEQSNGRQWAENFDRSGGSLYTVTSGTVSEEETTVLFTKPFLETHKLIPTTPFEKGKLSDSNRAKIESFKGWKVKDSHSLVKLSGNRSIFLVEFELKGDSALASLVVVGSDKILYKDFPAKYDETSTWSVDDGGQFGWEYYKILAVLEYEGKIELITDWVGAEGYNATYMQEEGQTFKVIKEGYRYTSPL